MRDNLIDIYTQPRSFTGCWNYSAPSFTCCELFLASCASHGRCACRFHVESRQTTSTQE